jgi:hypothetical protein
MKRLFYIFFVVCLCISCGQTAEKKSYEYKANTKPIKVASYEIMDQGRCLGFVYKYKYERPNGELRHYYTIQDINDIMIGYVGEHGRTIAYTKSGEENLGNNPLDLAVQKIMYTSSNMKLYFAGTTREPILEHQKIASRKRTVREDFTLSARRPSTSKKQKTTETEKDNDSEEGSVKFDDDEDSYEYESDEDEGDEDDGEREDWGDIDNEEW